MLKQLQDRARKWLKNNRKCHTVVVGHSYTSGRAPDVVGFTNVDKSYLIICIPDYTTWESLGGTLQQRDDYRLGMLRFILAPQGLLKFSEIPAEWGLIEADKHQIGVVTPAMECMKTGVAMRNEVRFLLSLVKRFCSTTKQDPDVFFESGYAECATALQKKKQEQKKIAEIAQRRAAGIAADEKAENAAKDKKKSDAVKNKEYKKVASSKEAKHKKSVEKTAATERNKDDEFKKRRAVAASKRKAAIAKATR